MKFYSVIDDKLLYYWILFTETSTIGKGSRNLMIKQLVSKNAVKSNIPDGFDLGLFN